MRHVGAILINVTYVREYREYKDTLENIEIPIVGFEFPGLYYGGQNK